MAPPVVVSAREYDVWTADVLRLRFDEVISFAGAALVDENINGVHDMRVALRRLRSALRDFADLCGDKSLKGISRELKHLAAVLGAVRDHDVAMIALSDLTTQTDDDSIKMGIDSLLDGQRIERERNFAQLQGSFSVRSLAELREHFTDSIDAVLHRQKRCRPNTLKDAASAVIGSRLRDLCDRGNAIYEPFASTKLHGLRIAAKRLRYAIELFGECLDDDIRAFADELAKLQANLGEVHDCDIWIDDLSSRLTRKKARNGPDEVSNSAEVWLLSKFTQKRTKEYRSALDLWREWSQNELIVHLRAAVKPSNFDEKTAPSI